MTEKSIRRLKRKFILVAMGALLSVMILMAGLIYFFNYTATRNNIRGILDYIIEHEGNLPGAQTVQKDDGRHESASSDYNVVRFLSEIFNTNGIENPEFYLRSSYFAVIYDAAGQVSEVITSGVESLTEEEAAAYGDEAMAKWYRFGKSDNYFYQVKHREDGSAIVVYLDSSYQFAVSRRLLYSAMILIGFGFIIAFLVVLFFSDRAIQPEIRNVELQKQFITNASHELKTPLAVIKANTEMQEILGGESEWTASTLRQVDRLTGLIQNLVMITRAQEREEKKDVTAIDLLPPVSETVKTFEAVSRQAGKSLELEEKGPVRLMAVDSEIRQLTSLLVDNAIKYCDANGQIRVMLSQKGKNAFLSVSNTYAEGKNVDYQRFFERFYRQDTSHNTDQGGYGIGLSIAGSIAEKYHSSLRASWKEGIITFSCTLKP